MRALRTGVNNIRITCVPNNVSDKGPLSHLLDIVKAVREVMVPGERVESCVFVMRLKPDNSLHDAPWPDSATLFVNGMVGRKK